MKTEIEIRNELENCKKQMHLVLNNEGILRDIRLLEWVLGEEEND